MEKIKSLYDISWQVDEPAYRADDSLSYSTLSKYERTGFNELDKLFDRIESPSLTFGSAVDSIITGGIEEFNERFEVAEFPECPDSIIKVVKELFTRHGAEYASLDSMDDDRIAEITEECRYQLNWLPKTRVKVIREKGTDYYALLHVAGDKTIIDTQTYDQVMNSVSALKSSPATRFYFEENNPFVPEIERLYQLKFKATLEGVDFRCMADLIVVDYEKKTVQPIDLKTSSHKEWDFYKSFVQWRYDIQARLYWRIIRDNMDRDPYFKEFTLLDYKFIVVNKETLTPLVWDYPMTKKVGIICGGKNGQIELRDPVAIGKELHYYLSSRPDVPAGINKETSNDLCYWLDLM